MKTKTFKLKEDGSINLTTLTKPVREILTQKINEERERLLTAFKLLLGRDSITIEDLKNCVKGTSTLLPGLNLDLKLKKDGTPDLRSFPPEMKRIYQMAQTEFLNQRQIAMNEIVTKATISEETLKKLIQAGEVRFESKWATSKV